MAVNFSEVLTDIGSGLGAFLDSIAAPLAYIVLILGIIGGVVSIFMGIAYVIKKSIK
jgi:F0F1-type ATP synthase assembly protein I